MEAAFVLYCLSLVVVAVVVFAAARDRAKEEQENREARAEVERLKQELAYWTAERKAAEKQLAELRAIVSYD